MKMNKHYSTLLILLVGLLTLAEPINAQNVGIGTTTPDPSAKLDIQSSNSGLLIPRLTETQKNNISSPANGLLIYQTDGVSGFYYYDGSIWKTFSGASTYNAGAGLTLTGSTFSVNDLAGEVIGAPNATVIGNNTINSAKIVDGTIASTDLANDLSLPGSASMTIPSGTTAQRPSSPADGMMRYNTTSNKFEMYQNGTWVNMDAGDDLGNHTATTTLNMGNNYISKVQVNSAAYRTDNATFLNSAYTSNQAAIHLFNGSDGSAPYIAFHRGGVYASNFGLDIDNQFAFGGWSAGNGYTGVKTGNLTVNGNSRITGLAGAGTRLVRTDASGNLVSMAAGTTAQFLRGDGIWAAVPSSADNLGNHTATTNLNMNTRAVTFSTGNIQPRTAAHGSLRIDGANAGYAGIHFGSVDRTLMMAPTVQGVYIPSSGTWQWYWNNGVLTVGTVPLARVSGTNYNIGNIWLRENGDNANLRLYGNTRQMVFRTDGEADNGALGAYAFAWTYGGVAAANRRMLLDHDGRLWTSAYGWLDAAFAPTSGSGNYIQNGTAAQSANAHITGYWRNSGTTGLYNQQFGTYFRTLNANYWEVRSNVGIQLATNSGAARGFIRHDATYLRLANSANRLVFVGGNNGLSYMYSATTTGTSWRLECNTTGARVNGNLVVLGTMNSNGYKETSDKRWKKNITKLENPLAKVMQIEGVNYYFKSKDELLATGEDTTYKFTDTKQIGFIAQDLEQILPEVVSTDNKGYKTVEYSKVVALLVEAVKEQQKQIEDLKQENASLKVQADKVKALEDKMQKIEALLEQVTSTEVAKK